MNLKRGIYLIVMVVNSAYSQNDDEKSSVTFAIDTTYSMTDDIQQVKESADIIFTEVMNSNHSHIENFVLVTFGDPITNNKVQTITNNSEEYKEALSSIKSDDEPNGDCPEFSMAGIIMALEKSLPSSYIYVFTDASAKDYTRHDEVKAIAQRKGSQVVFVLTGDCDGTASSDYTVYNEIAKVTSGQVFSIYKDEVHKILEYVKHITESRKTTILGHSYGPGNHTFEIEADSTMKELTISSAGKGTTLSILDSDKNSVDLEYLYNTSDNSVAVIRNAKKGTYSGSIDSDSNKTVTIHATTDVHFKYGFSSFKPTSIHNLPTEPMAGKKSYLAIQLIGDPKKNRLYNVNLVDLDDNIIITIPLKRVNRHHLYRTQPIDFPTTPFKISVIGKDTSNKAPFKRTSSTYIQQQNFNLVYNRIQNVPPKVSIEGWPSRTAIYKHALEINCVVTAYPKPHVVWLNKNTGETLQSTIYDLEPPLVYVYMLEIERATKDHEYICKASNDYGEDIQAIQIKVKDIKEKPLLDTTKYKVYVNNGTTAAIQCRVLKGSPKPTVKWYFQGLQSYEYIKMGIDGETMSKEVAGPHDAGNYRCVAENIAGRSEHETTLIVEYAPQITNQREYFRAWEGQRVILPCIVIGEPAPRVQWYRNGRVIRTIQRDTGAVTDYSLRNVNATTSNSGEYTCVAENQHGRATKDLHLETFVGVTIEPPKTNDITVQVGSRVTLPCLANGNPDPRVYWKIYSKQSGKSPIIERAQSFEKVLPRVQQSQEGTYICMASNTFSSANITYEVHVQAPPQIVDLSPDKEYVAVAKDAFLSVPCNAIGNPKPSITWLKNGNLVSLGSKWHDMDGNGTLILKNIIELSGGDYTCIATNDFGAAYMTYKVVVLPYPESQLPSSTKLLEQGQTVEIPCGIPRSQNDTLRWYKDGKIIKWDELILDRVNLSMNGIYTCRVNSLIRSVSESTRVEVGSKPSLSDARNITIQYKEAIDAFMDCYAEGKPKPKVEWRINGKLLDSDETTYIVKMGLDTLGDYTCNVSNTFGSAQKTFRIEINDCLLDLNTNQNINNPILRSQDNTALKINNGHILVKNNDEITITCPGGFKQYPEVTLTARCYQRNLFVNKEPIRYQDIECNNNTAMARITNRTCFENFSHNIIEVGLKTDTEFINAYDVCMDMTSRSVVYVKHTIDENASGQEHKFSWIYSNVLEHYDMESMYDCTEQVDSISIHLKTDFHKTDKCCFDKRQLVNSRDLPLGGMQKAAFIDLNVIPHWSTCNSENWEEVERRVRDLTKSLGHPLTVYTGVSYKIPQTRKTLAPIYSIVDQHKNGQAVPNFLWKIVQTPGSTALAIIQVNVPDLTLNLAHSYLLCKDVCHDTNWMKKPDWRDVRKGYTYCCDVEEFLDAFDIDDFEIGLTRPLMDSRLDLVQNYLHA